MIEVGCKDMGKGFFLRLRWLRNYREVSGKSFYVLDNRFLLPSSYFEKVHVICSSVQKSLIMDQYFPV